MAKTVTMVALAVMAFGCLLGLWVVGNGMQAAQGIQSDAKTKGLAMLEARLADWDADAFWRETAAPFRAANDEAGVRDLLARLERRLGPVRRLGETQTSGLTANARAGIGTGVGADRVIVAFTTEAEFARGPATVRWAVAREGRDWRWAKLEVGDDGVRTPGPQRRDGPEERTAAGESPAQAASTPE